MTKTSIAALLTAAKARLLTGHSPQCFSNYRGSGCDCGHLVLELAVSDCEAEDMAESEYDSQREQRWLDDQREQAQEDKYDAIKNGDYEYGAGDADRLLSDEDDFDW